MKPSNTPDVGASETTKTEELLLEEVKIKSLLIHRSTMCICLDGIQPPTVSNDSHGPRRPHSLALPQLFLFSSHSPPLPHHHLPPPPLNYLLLLLPSLCLIHSPRSSAYIPRSSDMREWNLRCHRHLQASYSFSSPKFHSLRCSPCHISLITSPPHPDSSTITPLRLPRIYPCRVLLCPTYTSTSPTSFPSISTCSAPFPTTDHLPMLSVTYSSPSPTESDSDSRTQSVG